MEEKRYYYRFDTKSDMGKKFRRLWNRCIKADKARVIFQERVGAIAHCPNDAMFAGGVEGVFFADDAKVNREVWREVGRSDDGSICWLPICKKREGVLTLPKGAERPADTVTRLYGKPFTDKRGHTVVRYIELYRDDNAGTKKAAKGQRKNLPKNFSQSIRTERARLKLPTVEVLTLLNLLQADLSGGKDDGKMHIVRPITPTFFEYWNRTYVGIAYPCHAEGMTEIDSSAYAEAARAARELERMRQDSE